MDDYNFIHSPSLASADSTDLCLHDELAEVPCPAASSITHSIHSSRLCLHLRAPLSKEESSKNMARADITYARDKQSKQEERRMPFAILSPFPDSPMRAPNSKNYVAVVGRLTPCEARNHIKQREGRFASYGRSSRACLSLILSLLEACTPRWLGISLCVEPWSRC